MAFRAPASPLQATTKTLILPAQGPHTATILFLHGLGQDASDWIDFVADNFSPALPGAKFVFPTAKNRAVTMSRGARMPAWYDVTSMGASGAVDVSGDLEESREHVVGLIEQELAAGISPSRIILAGFSQGGATALYTGLTLEYTVGGVLVMSGYLPNAKEIRPNSSGLQTHIFQTHGDCDETIPVSLAKESATKLKALGASKATFKVYSGLDHSTNSAEINDCLAFLRARLSAKTATEPLPRKRIVIDPLLSSCVYQQLRNGAAIFKIGHTNKAVKRHLIISPDLSTLRWIPSKKTTEAEFIHISDVANVIPGLGDKTPPLGPKSPLSIWLKQHSTTERAIELMSGQLRKLGGAHGGREAWKTRWFVLQRTKLFYYATPTDVAPVKDVPINIIGCSVRPLPDACAFRLEWLDGSQPDREFRATSEEARDTWVAMLRKALQFNVVHRRVGLTSKRAPVVAVESDKPPDTMDEIVNYTSKFLYARDPLAEPEKELSCTINFAEGRRALGPVSLVFSSLPMYDAWYAGLHRASCWYRQLSIGQQRVEYDAHLRLYPHDQVVRVLLGEVLEQSGDSNKALDCYLEAAAALPTLPSARRAAGRMLATYKADMEAALPHLEAAAALLERDDFFLLILLGDARMQQRHTKAALNAYAFACEIDTGSIPSLSWKALVGAGDSLRLLGRLEDAIVKYQAALAYDANSLYLHEHLATLLAKQGRHVEAAPHVAKLEKLKEAKEHELKACQLMAEGSYAASLEHWDVVVDACGDNLTLLTSAAECYMHAELASRIIATSAIASESSAAASTDPAIGIHEPEPDAAAVETSKTIGAAHLAKAEQLLLKVLSRDATAPAANLLCGHVYERLADLELAECAATLSASASDVSTVKAASGWSAQARWTKVEAFYKYVSSGCPDPHAFKALLSLGLFYQNRGRWNDAVVTMRAVLERDPENAAAKQCIADVVRAQEASRALLSPSPKGSAAKGKAVLNTRRTSSSAASQTTTPKGASGTKASGTALKARRSASTSSSSEEEPANRKTTPVMKTRRVSGASSSSSASLPPGPPAKESATKVKSAASTKRSSSSSSSPSPPRASPANKAKPAPKRRASSSSSSSPAPSPKASTATSAPKKPAAKSKRSSSSSSSSPPPPPPKSPAKPTLVKKRTSSSSPPPSPKASASASSGKATSASKRKASSSSSPPPSPKAAGGKSAIKTRRTSSSGSPGPSPTGRKSGATARRTSSSSQSSPHSDVDLLDAGVSRSFDPELTKHERNNKFFATLAEEKRKKAEDEKRKEEERIASMTPEQREIYETETAAKSKHDARKDKVLKAHLTAYSASPALRGKRGRGASKGR